MCTDKNFGNAMDNAQVLVSQLCIWSDKLSFRPELKAQLAPSADNVDYYYAEYTKGKPEDMSFTKYWGLILGQVDLEACDCKPPVPELSDAWRENTWATAKYWINRRKAQNFIDTGKVKSVVC
jgi:hypothetical protein